MALSIELLRALERPATIDELARRLDAPAEHLRGELTRLERRGYVRRLACEPTACGWCALRGSCAARSGTERWLRA